MQRFLVVLFIIWSTRVFAQFDRYYKRGDSNADGVVDIADASFTLNFLFLGGPEPPCPEAADANESDGIDIADPILTLTALFLESDQRIGGVGSVPDYRCLRYFVAQLVATPNPPDKVVLPGEVGADLGYIFLLGSEPLTVTVKRIGITFRTNIVTEEPVREIFLALSDGRIIAGPFHYAFDRVASRHGISRLIIGHIDFKDEAEQLHVEQYESLRVFATLLNDLEEEDGFEIITTASEDFTAITDKGFPVAVGRPYETSSVSGRVSRYRYQVRRAGQAQDREVVSDGVTEYTIATWEVEAEGASDAKGISRLNILPGNSFDIDEGFVGGLRLYAMDVFVATLDKKRWSGIPEYAYYASDHDDTLVSFNGESLLTLEVRGVPALGTSGKLALYMDSSRSFGPIEGRSIGGGLNSDHFIVDKDNGSGVTSFISAE